MNDRIALQRSDKGVEKKMKKLIPLMTALCLALALSLTALAEPASAAGGTLAATGSGVVQVASDVATVSLGVTEYSADVQEAQNTVNQKIAAVRAALIEAGVANSDINTDSIYIYANYDYTGDMQRVVGYNASNSLSIRTTQIERVGEFIDAAFAAGANQLNNISFSRQDITEAQAQALTLATQDAIAKATTIAEAAGVELGAIQRIVEGNDYSYDSGVNVVYAKEAAMDTAAGTDVQAAMISVSANVTVEYRISE